MIQMPHHHLSGPADGQLHQKPDASPIPIPVALACGFIHITQMLLCYDCEVYTSHMTLCVLLVAGTLFLFQLALFGGVISAIIFRLKPARYWPTTNPNIGAHVILTIAIHCWPKFSKGRSCTLVQGLLSCGPASYV
ncbi:hypothetical protein QBC33DRAFT_535719 [Phialemonium atrogriseum]|uniref:Uncharacterized protein n=1 Tax=Phialemonium atrogriseum TaxID=1093897 RepID=A0AAJ0C2K7_9PEZI|nr:uncharacterized protein QBC33DRAFT_535719 [Phialemonium atrogriseum]KAK1767943.1 hypothetical protein QBC33DRAFT_535719 [Phialemonium atrogriseum]